MTPAIKELMLDAVQYPLPMRIAAKVQMLGGTSVELHQSRYLDGVPDPIRMGVLTHLLSLEKGTTGLSRRALNRLAALARDL